MRTSLFRRARDPVSSLTHAIGAILSACGAVYLLAAGLLDPSIALPSLVGAIIFGLSLIALYSASAVYHYVSDGAHRLLRLRKLDHAMIYVLIAGTYTPITLTFLPLGHRFWFTAILWAVALAGIVVKLFWLDAPRWLSTSFYLLLGWALLFDFKAFAGIPGGCLALVAAGGLSYTVGAVLYIIKRPNLSPAWGFHELFHLFILLGSFLHFLAVVLFIL